MKITITMAADRATKFDFGQTCSLQNKSKFSTSFKSGGPLKLIDGSAKASVETTTTVASSATMTAFYTRKFNTEEGVRASCAPGFAPSRRCCGPSRRSR